MTIESIRSIIGDYLDLSEPRYQQMMRKVEEAYPAHQTHLRVKPLEWVEHWGGADDDLPSWRGKNPLGLHVSVDFIGKYKLSKHADAPEDELSSRKASAQADYERRILSALTTEGQP